jgi:hypothetical protein
MRVRALEVLQKLYEIVCPWAFAVDESILAEIASTDTDQRSELTREATSEVCAVEDLVGDRKASLDSAQGEGGLELKEVALDSVFGSLGDL